MSNESPNQIPEKPEPRWRNRLLGVGAAGLLAAAVSIGASATLASAQDDAPVAPADEQIADSHATDHGNSDEGDFGWHREFDEDDFGLDGEFDEGDFGLDGEFDEGDFGWEVSAADEAVFEAFDQCLIDAGVDEEALWDAEEDGTATDADWEALEAAFEGCEPILDGLSPELQAELDALEEVCDDYEDDLDDGYVEDADHVEEGSDAA